MKKLIYGIITLALAATVGCTPSESQIKQTATAIGYAAGLVANETPIQDKARNAIVEVLLEVRGCIPADGQSFAEAWEPIIKEKVSALIKEGKLDASLGDIVISTALLAAKGVDYLFDVRFPKARKYANLVSAGASGAIDGFLAAFPPVEGKSANVKVEYDKEAYEFFKKNK